MDPATITMIAKAAVTALSDEKLRKTIGWVIAAILSPIILIVVLICSLLSGTANHNNTAVDLTFNGGVISGKVPEEYRAYITEMRDCFTALDGAISEVESMMENGDSLDAIRVKAIFFALEQKIAHAHRAGDQSALNFGTENLSLRKSRAKAFVDCFVTYEDVHLCHQDIDAATPFYSLHPPLAALTNVPISELSNSTLTNEGKQAWADVLGAEVHRIYTGMYGLQIELSGVKATRIYDFGAALAGYCSEQEYEKWFTPEPEPPTTMTMTQE